MPVFSNFINFDFSKNLAGVTGLKGVVVGFTGLDFA